MGEYVRIFDAIEERGLDSNVSIKPSQFGLKIDEAFCHANIERVVTAAARHGNFVRIDMEDASTTDATLRNLLGVLSAKLELCASLPVYEWEAGTEGHEHCAAAFRNLAEAERRSCNEVLDQLREHLELRAAAGLGADR